MTLTEANFAMENRLPVILARGAVILAKPKEIIALTKVRRSEFDEERGKGKYYWEARLVDAKWTRMDRSRTRTA